MNTPASSFKTASSSLPVGTRLGEFEITGVIGEGGFGIVYSAHDSSLDRIVAIKEYLPAAFAQRGADGHIQAKSEEHAKTVVAGLASFINEAKMLAKFSHAGLVEVFRFWEANGTGYMAMRYYRGVTLRELRRSSPQLVTEQWLCETLDPILLAIKELHNEKCYHRDIAPDNILVLPNGRSVLMDFGAARRIISGMTQALTTVLKPGYAPIEQYYDDGSMPQGAWTDIYAIGGLLYHVMSGKVPVQAIARMVNDPLKPISEVATGNYSTQLSSVVMKCMAVLPENRYQSIDELRTALGWMTTPVISTFIHKPLPVQNVSEDCLETVIMKPSPTELAALAEAAAASASSRKIAPVPVDKPKSDPDATVITPLVRAPSPVKEPSIDELIKAPAPVHQIHAPEVPKEVKVPVPAKKSLTGLHVAFIAIVASIIMVIAGTGYFFFGKQTGSESVVVAQTQEQAVVPAKAQEAPVLPAAPVAIEPVADQSPATSSLPVAAVQPESTPIAVTPPAAPAATTGSVRIELKGGWGTVFIDNEQKGTVPPVLVVKLPTGSHEIEIRNPAVPTVKRVVVVNAGKTTVLRHSFGK